MSSISLRRWRRFLVFLEIYFLFDDELNAEDVELSELGVLERDRALFLPLVAVFSTSPPDVDGLFVESSITDIKLKVRSENQYENITKNDDFSTFKNHGIYVYKYVPTL